MPKTTHKQKELPIVNVVAAVRRRDGKFWVVRRTDAGSHGGLAGMWEYPGGKVEADEELPAALKREMLEEFGVDCVVGRMLDCIDAHTEQYADNIYRVHFFQVFFMGEPELREHDGAQWLSPPELMLQEHLPSGREFNRRLLVTYNDERARITALVAQMEEDRKK